MLTVTAGRRQSPNGPVSTLIGCNGPVSVLIGGQAIQMLTDGLSSHRVSNGCLQPATRFPGSFLGSSGAQSKAAKIRALRKIGDAGRLLLIDEP